MHIWVPKIKIAETRDPLIVPQNRVKGLFRIRGVFPDGRERVIADWTPNLITDGGLDRWGTGAVVNYCYVGTGNTEPTVFDTGLVSPVAYAGVTSETTGAQASAPYYAWTRLTHTFATSLNPAPPGSGTNLAEIGFGWLASAAPTSLWSRALIKDILGDPTTITWLKEETLVVDYEVRKYPPLVDVVGESVISGVTYGVTMRAGYVTHSGYWQVGIRDALSFVGGAPIQTYAGDIGPITYLPDALIAAVSSTTSNTYVSGSYKFTGTATCGPTNSNHVNGIVSLFHPSSVGSFQMQFDPPIPKVVDYTLVLNMETGVWGRA
jgi:hypothetical protein